MKEPNMKNDDVRIDDEMDEGEMDELEPLVLAKVTEVTGEAPDGSDDWRKIVWGNL